MGGEPVVKRVVDETIDRAASDSRTRRSFDSVKLARVKEEFAEQVCGLSGGPCKYTGDPMDQVHKGLKNTEAELNLLDAVPARRPRRRRRRARREDRPSCCGSSRP